MEMSSLMSQLALEDDMGRELETQVSAHESNELKKQDDTVHDQSEFLKLQTVVSKMKGSVNGIVMTPKAHAAYLSDIARDPVNLSAMYEGKWLV